MQVASVSASIHFQADHLATPAAGQRNLRMMSTIVVYFISFLAAARSIPPKIRYFASESRRFRTLSFALRNLIHPRRTMPPS
jgi:hypothetical protein